jgi:hypothetical protein
MNAEELDCPVLNEALALGMQMQGKMSHLKSSRKVCKTCRLADDCPVKALLARAVAQAVREALQELEG